MCLHTERPVKQTKKQMQEGIIIIIKVERGRGEVAQLCGTCNQNVTRRVCAFQLDFQYFVPNIGRGCLIEEGH